MYSLYVMSETTLHELAADWSWMEGNDGFMILGSPDTWEQAEYGPRGGLRISRLVPDGPRVREIRRYADPEQKAFLVPTYTPSSLEGGTT